MTIIEPGFLGVGIPLGQDGYNPFGQTNYLLTVQATAPPGWIVDANHLLCEFVGWERGEFGDPRDPECKTQTLIGKPLDVLVPPMYRQAHHLYRIAFQQNPIPRTMGEGRNTPIWVKDPNVIVDGIESITGHHATVLIGLSAIDADHTLAVVQPMEVSRRFVLPDVTTATPPAPRTG